MTCRIFLLSSVRFKHTFTASSWNRPTISIVGQWPHDGRLVGALGKHPAIKQYDGLKHTNDHSDARWLAQLLRWGILPTGYIYPKEERSVRRKRFGHFLDIPWGFTPPSVRKARSNWLFGRLSLMSSATDSPLLTVQAFILVRATMPSADSSRPVRIDHSTLSLAAKTEERSPEVSSTGFSARPPDLQPALLMDRDSANPCSLVQHSMPRICFLPIGPCICSTLPLDPASRRGPCAIVLPLKMRLSCPRFLAIRNVRFSE